MPSCSKIPVQWWRLVALLLPMAPLGAFACDRAQVEAVLRSAYPEARMADHHFDLSGGDMSIVVSQVECRPWLARPGLLLLAVPLRAPVTEEVWRGDLEVIVANADTLAVRARHRRRGRLDSDAWYFDGLSLDTARYQLTDSLHAFGIRIGFRGSSRVNPARETALTLYVLRGDALEPVLQDLVVRHSWGEWDGQCAGEFGQVERTVAVAPSGNSAWADLVVSSRAADSVSREEDGECVLTEDKPVVTVERIGFKDDGYPVMGMGSRFER